MTVRSPLPGVWGPIALGVVFAAMGCPQSPVPADDAGVTDAGVVADAGGFDSGVIDAGAIDGGALDAGTADAGQPDAGQPDGGAVDGGLVDGGLVDGGNDAGTPDAGTTAGVGDPTFTDVEVIAVDVQPYGDPADVYVPITAGGEPLSAPFPSVVLLQGGDVDRQHYSSIATAVSRYGYVVIVPNHERFFAITTGLFSEVDLIEAALTTLETQSALSGSPLFGKVDPLRAGVLAHSLGGAVGLEAIGNECSRTLCTSESFSRPGAVRAAVFYGANRKPPLGNNIPTTANTGLPILMLQGSVDGAATLAAGQTTFDRIIDPPRVFGVLDGANHYAITNENNPSGAAADSATPTLAQQTGLEMIARWTGVFLNAHVRDDAAAQAYVYDGAGGSHPNLALQIERPVDGPEQLGPCAFKTVRTTVAGGPPITVLLPEGSASASAPVVVFNPGLNLSADLYVGRLQHLASWCYAVVANATTYTPLSVTDVGWQEDVEAMMSWVDAPTDPLFTGRFGPERVLLGHSAGAKNSLRVAAADATAFDAIVTWDVAGSNPVASEDLATINSPVLLLGETFSAENALFGQYCAPAEQNFEVYFDGMSEALPTLAVTLNGADHMSFLDNRGCGLSCTACPTNTSLSFGVVGRQIRRLSVAWLERFIRDDSAYETYLFGSEMDAEVAAGRLSVQER